MASSSSSESLKDIILLLLDPWLFMGVSLRHVPSTVVELLRARDLHALLSPARFRNALFGNFWATVGPSVKSNAERRVVPLLEGRVRGGEVVTDGGRGEGSVPPAGGVVIEVGAGTGMWADVFAKIGADARGADGEQEGGDRDGLRQRSGKTTLLNNDITKIYGVEPHPKSAATLRQRVRDLGIDDVYEVVPVGIESLADPSAWPGTTIEPGSVDCIVSVLCLCSIPDQADNIRRLYELLRPGGRWYVYEHVRVAPGRPFLRFYQWVINLFWPLFLGSCRICCDTETNLRQAGPWKEIDLVQPPAESAYHLLPHILGTLTK